MQKATAMTQQSADLQGVIAQCPLQNRVSFEAGTGQATLTVKRTCRRAAAGSATRPPQTHTWQGRLPLRVSQAQFLTHSLRDLTVSVLLAEQAGDSWGGSPSANTGESLHGSYCSGSFQHQKKKGERVLACVLVLKAHCFFFFFLSR